MGELPLVNGDIAIIRLDRCDSVETYKTEISDFHAIVLVNEQVSRFEVAMDDVIDAMEPIHAEGSIFGHAYARRERCIGSMLAKERFEISAHQFRYNSNITTACGGTHKEYHIRMENLTHDAYFVTKIFQLFFCQVLLHNRHFDGHCLSSTPSSTRHPSEYSR